MPRSAVRSFFGAATLFAASLCAQTTYVVDRLNRPGTDFLDVPAAAAAAADGDTLLLRSDAGVYTPVTTGKGLRIVGDAVGPAIFSVAAGAPGFVVSGLPAGRDFVLRNCMVLGTGVAAGPRLRLENCLGRVHLQQVEVAVYTGAVAIDVFACQAVTLRQCEATGTPGLRVQNATASVMDTRCHGTAASTLAALPAAPGLWLQNASAQLTNVQAFGGLASGPLPPAPGAFVAGAVVAATGVAGLPRFVAGAYGTSSATGPVPAVDGQNSLLELDPEVQLVPRGGAAAVVGATPVSVAQAALSVTGSSVFSVAFAASPTAAQVTLIGFPRDPLFFPGISGRLWIDDAAMLVLPGVLGGFGGFAESQLPPAVTLVLQVLSLDTGSVQLTAPAVLTPRF